MYSKYIKRFFDILLALCCIVICSPALLILSVLVRLKLGSPIIFKQERPGYQNKVFTLYKFRSMTDVVDQDGNLLPDQDRLPRFGRLLRSTSLDELPEFFNILFGHMSFVGPRPLLKNYVDLYSPRQIRRANVRPGLTGLAQVNGRNAISWEEKFEFDLEYVENISFWLDVQILIQTFLKVVKRSGISSRESVTMSAFQGTRRKRFSRYHQEKELRILFVGIGSQVELVETFLYAAGKLDVKVRFVGCDVSLESPALYKCHKYYQVPEPGDDQHMETILSICREEGIDVVIPGQEIEVFLLSQEKKRFERLGTRVLIGNEELACFCSNKKWTGKFFESLGLHYPRNEETASAYDQGYPALMEILDQQDNFVAARKVQSAEDLKFLAKKYDRFVIRPYLEGKIYEIDAFCGWEGNPIYITPRAKEDVEGRESSRYRVVRDQTIVEETKRILEKLKLVGAVTIFMLKQKENDMNFYLRMEPWFDKNSVVSIKAGADAPMALLQMLLGNKLEFCPDAADHNILFGRFEQSVCLNTGKNGIQEIQALEELLELDDSVEGVLFDLDDTLYSEKEYVRSGFHTVAKLFPQIPQCFNKLCAAFEKGQNPVKTVLTQADLFSEESYRQCISAVEDHSPKIQLYKGVRELFVELHKKKKSIGIITDGKPKVQRAKIKALGLDTMADEYLITDELAGNGDVNEFRRPNDIAFLIMKKRMGIPCRNMAFVGDDRERDFAAPESLGMECYWKKNKDGLYE